MPSYETFIKTLLAPLGIYDLTRGTLNESELYAIGKELDCVAEKLMVAEREALINTAEDAGLCKRESLFAKKPVSYTVELRRKAIIALLRIAADSFSLEEINRTISGCGITALAKEMGSGKIRVLFPDVAGIPDGFEQIQKIVQDIIPCHLETEFYFRYMLWSECEAHGWTWNMIHTKAHTWHSFELAV